MNLKFQFFDTEKKEWFKPSYKPLNDMFITGNGDVYHAEEVEGKVTLRIVTQHVKPVQYVGIPDTNGKKYYTHDIVKFKSGVGVLIYYGDRLCIGSGPIDNYTAIDPVSEKELREAERLCSSIEAPKFYDNYVHE